MRRNPSAVIHRYRQRTNPDNPTNMPLSKPWTFLIEHLRWGKSKMLAAYLIAMAEFYQYSFGNTALATC